MGTRLAEVWPARTDGGEYIHFGGERGGVHSHSVTLANGVVEYYVSGRAPQSTAEELNSLSQQCGTRRNDYLVPGHISVDRRDVQWKNQCINLFQLGDSKKMKNNMMMMTQKSRNCV